MNWVERKAVGIITILLLAVVLSFCIGLYVRDWPILKMDYEFKITDVLNIFITLILAVFIPFYIKYLIDRGQKLNDQVLNEIKAYRDHVEVISQRFMSIYQSGLLTPSNKTELSVLLEILDGKLDILDKNILQRCKNSNNAANLISELTQNQILFWRTLTDNTLVMSTSISRNKLSDMASKYQQIIDTVVKINLLVSNI